jgi:CDP-glycerol glycerophosphotransferase
VDLVQTDPAPLLVSAHWEPEATLSLRLVGGPDLEAVVLRAQLQEETVPFAVTSVGDEVNARLAVAGLPRFGESVPIRSGTWDVAARTASGREVPVRIGPGQLDHLPVEQVYGDRRYVLTDRRLNTLSVLVETDLSWSERGTANQHRLRTEFYPAARGPVQDVVLYESYYGKQFSDSPREIFAELRKRDPDLHHVIAVRDQQVAVPEGATGVSYRSEEYYRLLAQARYIVANTHLPSCFRRAEGQTVLQTWHGVGTKKIGLDMGAVHFANKSYVENIRNGESDQWDYLVSPNPFTSPILRRAFAYRGHLLETGVPRNDIFHRADRDARALAVKQRLGIEADRKVVLYAPTWRDNLFDGPGRYRLDLRLDLYEAVRKLGDDYVLLFRKHSNIVDRLPLGEGAVIDASDYPEVQELLLATDVLISDYSTLMCDFANTGRPMLFYTYDLANYRDVLRGFYFDFEDEVPGPLITDEADLVAAIADADAIRAEYDAKYRAFAERFCAWDDGRATERVVDAVFGEVR